jgi:hypothetical protein
MDRYRKVLQDVLKNVPVQNKDAFLGLVGWNPTKSRRAVKIAVDWRGFASV